jgi:hypothetical protein
MLRAGHRSLDAPKILVDPLVLQMFGYQDGGAAEILKSTFSRR